jgi:hypothetical protein
MSDARDLIGVRPVPLLAGAGYDVAVLTRTSEWLDSEPA